ncbi:sensor histidine kinase [Ekhidna sp. To15]|uniref:sensor histidine kinase n=1 Tax=Ekhidna sp. To15 TaxID=3395267 RepID=UPI003F526989
MKISKYKLAVLFLIVISSLGVLLFMQFQIVERDIQKNQTMMESSIAGILSDLYDIMMFNSDLAKFTNAFYGSGTFEFTNESNPTDSLQIILKNGLDEVMSLNYPDLDYKVDGFISGEYGCIIHRTHRSELPRVDMLKETDNHMCFCMVLNNTLDISMTYTNKEEILIGDSAGILRASFLVIVVIISSFWYTIYTIRKQRKLSDLKRDFVNNLTHEFKTPIFSISLAAKSIRESGIRNETEKLDSYANLISNESRRLQGQVDKILQMAMLDSGNLNLEKKKIDLHELIKNVTEGFKMIIEQKDGIIDLHLDAQESEIIADETHLSNTLFNLIDNAQKYSSDKPQIEIRTESNQSGITFHIKDQGIGMDKSTQKYIFDQFYRAQKGDVHNVKGFGLGLSYVKRIIELHNGTIELKSEPANGSEFKIYIPFTK